jgi:PAS domain S-box-containing protein
MSESLRMLMVEDNPADADFIRELLPESGPAPYQIASVARLAEALTRLERKDVDLVLLDLGLPDSQGLATLHQLRQAAPEVAVIVLTGTDDAGLGAAAIRDGAQDYLVKGQVNGSLLTRAVRYAWERKRAEAIREALLSLTTRLSEVRTPVEVARTIFAVADRLWKWDSGVLAACAPEDHLMETVLCSDIVDGERREMEPAGTRGEPTPRMRRVLAQGPELVLRGPHELLVSDSVMFGDTTRLSASIMSVPIRQQDRPVGVLSFQSYTPDAFTQDELRTLQGLADHCGGALERLQAEEALRRREEDYRMVIHTTHEGFWMMDPQGSLLDVNEAYCRLSGYSREQLLTMRISDIEAAESPEQVQRHIEQINATGFDRFETRHRCADGRLVELEVSANYVPGSSGGRRFAFFRDVTQRNQAAVAQARLATAVEHAAETIMITDPDGTILYVNPAFEKVTGHPREEAIGQNARILKSGKHDAEFYRRMWAVLTAGQVWSGHLINRRKDGTLFEEDASISPVLDAAGRIVNYVAVKHDVTEQRKLEAQFLRSQRLESIGRLAGGIAHDLNNILTPILMVASLLREGVSPAVAGPLIDTIAGSAQRGADIVKQLVTFARGTEGHKIPVPPTWLIKEMARIIQETFPKSITLRLQLPKDLWLVLGDPTQLHQVLLNLCVNARDAMPEGGTLTLAAENLMLDDCYAGLNPEAKAGPYVLLQVSDTGTGMSPEIMDKIFDPFFTTKGLETGTGLGLATVQGIVKSHGGFIQVESQEGCGSRFRSYLPAQPAAESAAVATPGRELPRGHGECVLVVDDEQTVREITRRILEKHGYRVLTANDGLGASALYEQHRAGIQVVLTDMMMPVMDGVATIRVLHGMNPQVRIIAASGAASKVRLTEIANLSVQAYLQKPLTAQKLLVTLAQVLHGEPVPWQPGAG